MEREIITVWITKYALTQGIEEKEVEVCSDISSDMVSVVNVPYQETYHGEGKDWHRIKESAIKKAEEMRNKKIKTLEKQIQKLKEMKFE